MANYNLRLIKSRRSYNTTEMALCLGMDRKTCQRWIKIEGLKPIERGVSPLVMGEVLKTFLKERAEKRKIKLNDDEFYCMKCHISVKAKIGSEKIIKTGKKIGKIGSEQFIKKGLCGVCNTEVNRFLQEYKHN